ncbi:type III secretion protein T [Izhakiella capsodis]|uniref:Type III secretion protein T n=1 Tax=Izhakiella capsodis TaxID=1367852 RepID=A0A1I5AW38_9GAMM|nr:type III secretion system export apparatus subunit SctT [Izhakiella capsodis]SFN66658.1 type III secretion protein T [Izhakiella capsodis]
MHYLASYFYFQHSVLIFVLAYTRLSIAFYMLPVLGRQVLSNFLIKNMLISLTIIGLWPCIRTVMIVEQSCIILLTKECIIGLMLAMTLCIPFWVVMGFGEIMDNQRGATISDSIDPVNGSQSSILSGFFNFTLGAIFFSSGGMKRVIAVMSQSYHVFPIGSSLGLIHWALVGRILQMLMQNSILLAAPVMLSMMLSEILLGVFSRYCPQLNAFSLSLTIKSFIVFFIFIYYGFDAFSEKTLQMFSLSAFQQFIF